MLFWNNKKDDLVIQCSVCEWQPDGEIHWACSCGHRWNTFKTKGKCPNCKTQWKDTWCPGCGKSTPHKNWYKTKEDLEMIENSSDPTQRRKKKSLESKLINYGIKNYRVSYLSCLDHSKEKFKSPYDAGCRMIILYAIGYLVHNLEERPSFIDWFKKENIWEKVSPNEKDFLIDISPDEDLLMDLSWRIESAITLGWCINKVNTLSRLDEVNNELIIEEFQQNIPELGESLIVFLSQLEYRRLEEIYEENLLNELATTYFRDLLFNGKEDTTRINRSVSFERHQVLNWLRFNNAEETEVTGDLWDNTDTST